MAERKFKNSWSRLSRAEEHLASFQHEWHTLLTKDGFAPVTRYDKDSGWTIASAIPNVATEERIRDNTLSLVVGEYAYQLRAALDGLIWDAFTLIQGSEPTAKASSLYFPIYTGDRAKTFQKDGFGVRFPKKLEDWLKSIQPETPEKPEEHPDWRVAAALTAIHDLARFDRHRRLRIIGAIPTVIGFAAFQTPPTPPVSIDIAEWDSIPCDVLNKQYDFLRFKVSDGTIEFPNKMLEIHLTFEVAFEDIRPVAGVPSGDRLPSFAAAANYIIDRFEQEFV